MDKAARTTRLGRFDSFFYLDAAIATTAFVVYGFGPTYYFKGLFDTQDLGPIRHIHGFVFSAWLGLFVMQAVTVYLLSVASN